MATENMVNRRDFLKASASGGAAFILGFCVPARGRAQASSPEAAEAFKPNAWIRITRDNQITVLVENPEMGQGPRTMETMMLAEELEADWSTIRVEQAPVVPEIHHHLATGGSGGTEWAGIICGRQARKHGKRFSLPQRSNGVWRRRSVKPGREQSFMRPQTGASLTENWWKLPQGSRLSNPMPSR
jgi:CO/xanthine dehydrogenase Mo-binding subunit